MIEGLEEYYNDSRSFEQSCVERINFTQAYLRADHSVNVKVIYDSEDMCFRLVVGIQTIADFKTLEDVEHCLSAIRTLFNSKCT